MVKADMNKEVCLCNFETFTLLIPGAAILSKKCTLFKLIDG